MRIITLRNNGEIAEPAVADGGLDFMGRHLHGDQVRFTVFEEHIPAFDRGEEVPALAAFTSGLLEPVTIGRS